MFLYKSNILILARQYSNSVIGMIDTSSSNIDSKSSLLSSQSEDKNDDKNDDKLRLQVVEEIPEVQEEIENRFEENKEPFDEEMQSLQINHLEIQNSPHETNQSYLLNYRRRQNNMQEQYEPSSIFQNWCFRRTYNYLCLFYI